MSSIKSKNNTPPVRSSAARFHKSIASKFLLIIGAFVIIFSAFIFYRDWRISTSHTRELLSMQADLALQFDLAIRQYVAESVRPFAQQYVKEDDFMPETMSTSFVARSVFEKVRKQFPDYVIKFSSGNPRNPLNHAGPEELEMIQYFNDNSDVQQWSGQIDIDHKPYLVRFAARRLTKSCMQCHGDPKDAPRSMIARYGDRAGFHQKLGDVVALDTIAIPVQKYKKQALQNAVSYSFIIIAGAMGLLAAAYVVFRFLIANLQKEVLQREKVEQEVQHQNEFLQTVIESLTCPFYVIDVNDYSVKLANTAAKTNELSSHAACYSITHNRHTPCKGPGGDCPIESVKKTKKPVMVEHQYQDKHRHVRYVEVHCYPLLDDQGNVSQVIEYTQDITDRKIAQQRIVQEQNNLEAIFEASPVAMFLIDESCTIKKINNAALKMVGKGRSQSIGRRPGEILECIYAADYGDKCGNAPECAFCQIRRIITQIFHSENPVFDTEIQHTFKIDHKTGDYWLNMSMQMVVIDNHKHIIMAFHNISDRKEAEVRLKEAKAELEKTNDRLKQAIDRANLMAREAVHANKAKSQFLANMSHEIRTPLNSILGFSNILSKKELDEQNKECVAIIQESGLALLNLINDILDFSKIEAGRMDVESVECMIEPLLYSIKTFLMPSATAKGLHFEIQLDHNLPAKIKTDPNRLKQCLINLAQNAVKFTNNGHIYVHVMLRHVSGKPYIRFDVEDTGIGIPKDKQEAIYDSFTQVDGSSTRKFGGTGLGLAITRQLAQLLGGNLTLKSQFDHGSTFSLTIPANIDITHQPRISDTGLTFDHHSKKECVLNKRFAGQILVAEDVVANQKLMINLLEDVGLSVTIASNGEQALQIALNQSFDLIFMDIQMPRINGYEVTRSLRKASIATPIIALTAHATEQDKEQCLDAGCNDFLAKPLDTDLLYQLIQRYLPEQTETPSDNDASDTEININNSENDPIIDWPQLIERMRKEKTIAAVVEAWLDEGQCYIEDLKKAIIAADADNIHRLAHTLKGASATISANHLSQLAYALEMAAKQHELQNMEERVAEISHEYEKLKTLISNPDWMNILKKQCNVRPEKENKTE